MSEKSGRVIISVISDLVTDQRVNRSATSLHLHGYQVMLVGRVLRDSLPIEKRPYNTKRFSLFFERGPLFYAVYNLRLFFFLLFTRADIFFANDLDTLPANYLASALRRKKLVYDSHEYFTEVPELIRRPFIRSIWLGIEKWIFPKLEHIMTVNESIAAIYTDKYKKRVTAIRNLPIKNQNPEINISRGDWGIPDDPFVFLFQGAGINIDRGAEEAIEAIKLVDGAVLLFIGAGDVVHQIRKRVEEEHFSNKIFFIPKQPFDKLLNFTRLADCGLTLDKDTNLNYRYSLPNKLFDYIRAGLPVLATDLTEVKKIINHYKIGLITASTDASVLSENMKTIMHDRKMFQEMKENLKRASAELCWENEEPKFLKIFMNVT